MKTVAAVTSVFIVVLLALALARQVRTGGDGIEQSPVTSGSGVTPPPGGVWIGSNTAKLTQTPDHQDIPITPITTSTGAVSMTVAVLPPSIVPYSTTVRLLSNITYNELFLGNAAGDYETPAGPVWLVGFHADDLTIDEILPPPWFWTPPATPEILPGAYVAWDANAGYEIGRGALELSGGRSLAAIEALPNESLTIVEATEVPTFD